MKNDRLDKICQMVRSLREEAGPTMSVGANGYTGKADDAGPTAGYDPVLSMVDRRKKRFKSLSSEERKILIRKKLELQGLTEGSGVKEKDQSAYDEEEVIDLIILTRCFQKNQFK